MPNHPALDVARAILEAAHGQGYQVTPMQLQKLLYFANGWNLEIRNEPLVSDSFQAWQFGPVHPAAYQAFKKFGSNAIDSFPENGSSGGLSVVERGLVEEIVGIYGGLSGPQMSHLTHKVGTPWRTVWNDGIGRSDDIPSDLISEHFRALRKSAA